jgi:hypothetical protein
MTPLNAKLADEQYVVGETYRLAPYEERSLKSHSHFFAAVNDAWGNLPPEMADRFPSPDHLRKYALIKTGFCDKDEIVCASNDDSIKLAAFARSHDQYAVIQVSSNVVTIWTAESQKMRKMGNARFQDSKDCVLTELSRLIGVSTDDLKKNAKQAA